ncbi:MAG: helix-turn-helix transcriptional regulator [Candidatus Wildermuthbacteria bacterium]|nr:helix-turn-helix transcriptional regulator [Candidatus Wildermuthbacteria bacterium]
MSLQVYENQPKLSRREREVLSLVARGLDNKEVARRLCVAVNTVRTHLHSVNVKLGAQNRTHAVILAFQRGICELPRTGPTVAGLPPTPAEEPGPQREKPQVNIRAPESDHNPLTSRQVDVLSMLALGMTYQKIAGKLFLSLPTVKHHAGGAISKLNARNALHAVAIAIWHGLLPDPNQQEHHRSA